MKVAIVAATQMEWQPIKDRIASAGINPTKMDVMFFTTGIGVMATTYSLVAILAEWKPNMVIQVGIAGAFAGELSPGEVVAVSSDCSGDLVVEEKDGLADIFDLGLQHPHEFPFLKKKIFNPWVDKLPLHKVRLASAVTVSEITTRPQRISVLQHKYQAELETMEGVALHFVCSKKQVPFLQLKGISNYIGERDKQQWKIKEALNNLCDVVLPLLKNLDQERLLND